MLAVGVMSLASSEKTPGHNCATVVVHCTSFYSFGNVHVHDYHFWTVKLGLVELKVQLEGNWDSEIQRSNAADP